MMKRIMNNTEVLTNCNEVRAELLRKGLNFNAFARKHQYKTQTVSMAIYRWAGRQGEPRGKVTREILHIMEQEIGKQIYRRLD